MAFIGKPLAQPLDIGSQKTVSSPNYFADHGYRERSSTKIKPLICGEAAFSAVSLALKRAQRSINMAFWGLDPATLLERGKASSYNKQSILAEILISKARSGIKVKVIVWDHPVKFVEIGR
ncbi:MAG TPA: hypothetical protein EYP10_13420, partial [Armatimonadetes bacterium]|nr:hypothetical protein [Armatimonadota bacterium]